MKRVMLPPGPATCAHCGGPFERVGHMSGYFRIYCNKRCMHRAHYAKNPKRRTRTVSCVGCRKTFVTDSPLRKYCDRECRKEDYRRIYDAAFWRQFQGRTRTGVYLPDAMWLEIRTIAAEKGRKVSRLMQHAWRIARAEIRALEAEKGPSAPRRGRPPARVAARTPARPIPFPAPGLRRTAMPPRAA